MSEFHYPGGMKPPRSQVDVPKGKKLHLKVAPGNRGLDFEAEINQSNDYYVEKGLALITKRPTPIQTVKVDYAHGPKITEAFFQTQSTTDYNGVYKGHYVDFEAKECRSKTSFPLHNVPPQQIDHLKAVIRHGGIAFFLIRFALLDATYFLPASYLIAFLESGKRQSIPVADIKTHGKKVPEGFRPRYDYLPLIDEVFLK